MGEAERLINRADRLSFMDVGTEELPSFVRMTKFTSMVGEKNPKEYSRQYVDMATETSDVVGYAPSVGYSFDRHMGNKVHEKIAQVTDDELLGSDTYVDIVTVDLFTENKSHQAIARKRTYSIVPDGEGDGTDALIYSGNFKAVSGIVLGYVTSSDNWKTVEFKEGSIPAGV